MQQLTSNDGCSRCIAWTKMRVQMDMLVTVAERQNSVCTATLTMCMPMMGDAKGTQPPPLVLFDLESKLETSFQAGQLVNQIIDMNVVLDFDDGNALAHGTT